MFFKCKTCKVQGELISHLIEQNKALTDRLVAISQPAAMPYFMSNKKDNQYYNSDGEVILYEGVDKHD